MARIGQIVQDDAHIPTFGPSSAGDITTVTLPTFKRQSNVAAFAFAGGCLWALYILLASRGVTTQDAIGHFVISREAWHRPALMLHHWGRPIDTLLYMPAAYFGLVYARLTSLVLAALTVLLTLRLAQRLDVEYAFVVPLLLWFQPGFLDMSVHPSLSEIPFSLMMVASALLFLSKRFTLASVLIGLMPLVRHEAIALMGLWVAICLWKREWGRALLALLPIVGYTVLYRGVFGQPPGGEFPILPRPGMFGIGHSNPHLLYYPKVLALGVGLPVTGLAMYSLPLLVRSAPRLAVFGWYGAYMALHMALYRVGYAAGAGNERYMFPMAPAVAVAAALGLGALIGEVRLSLERLLNARAKATRFSYALLAIFVVAVLIGGLRTKPVPLDSEGAAARLAAAWLRQQGLASGPIITTHAYVHYFLPGHLLTLRPGGDPEALWYDPPDPSAMAPGTIAVWDSHYSNDYGLPYTSMTSRPQDWNVLKQYQVDDARLVIFRKHAP